MKQIRLIPEHFKDDGRPKRSFETRAEAERYLDKGANIYRCTFCRKFHVGH